MIPFILDTDSLTLIQEGHAEVCRRFLEQPSDTVAITVLSVEEQLSGWYTQVRKAKRPERLAWAYRRLADAVGFLARLRILTYDEQLRKAKIKIGRMDLRIAAVALEHGAVLVTRNARDFRKVP